ncbi:MAG: C13 family peptidase [Methanobacteriota archaeon]
MQSEDKKLRSRGISILVLVLILTAILFIFPVISDDDISSVSEETIHIGVLLPLTGPNGMPLLDALKLGEQQINTGGGIEGKLISLVYRDTRTGNLRKYAEELANDPSIQVVIGPYTSDELFQISDLFIKKQKVLISPSASSDEIFRAFAGTGNVWRLRTNDRDITSVVMQHLSAHHAQSVGVLSPNSTYGKTFYDWIPFWAIETGVNLTECVEYSDEKDIPAALTRLNEKNPDYIIFVYSGSNQDIFSALKTLRAVNSSSHLYLIQPSISDNGFVQEKSDAETLLGALVSGQWQLQDTSTISALLPEDTLIIMSPSPDSEFASEYIEFSGKEPSFFVSEVYDALLVASEVMCYFNENSTKSPMNAANTVLGNSTGTLIPRTESGFQSAFDMIEQGEIPVMTGASGPLTFDPEGVDRESPWYQTYRIEAGLVIKDSVHYQTIGKREKSDELIPDTTSDPGINANEKKPEGDFWAVIGGLSKNWTNYRHQADALTMYQILKERGVPDDHIILLVYDDIPYDIKNTEPGEVYHLPDTEEVRKGAVPDYSGDQITRQLIEDILSGTLTRQGTPVLGSNENSTVLLYLVSHGAQGGLLIVGEGKEVINPDEFASVINKMKEHKKFGQMLVVLESCFSGAMASKVTTPGVLVMTATGENETSKSAVYDSKLSNWLSDEFTDTFVDIIRTSGDMISVRDLYNEIYPTVRSSHPGVINNNNSFSMNTPVMDFFGGTGSK